MLKSKWWIFLLLTSFSLLLVPKGIWHDCEQQHQTKKSTKTEYSIEKEHCNVCDFQFYPSIIQSQPVFFFAKSNTLSKPFIDYQLVYVYPKLTSLRGPPTDLF